MPEATVNIFKFVIWAWAITVLGAISNLIISFPLSLRTEKYGPREDNPERATSIPSVFARPGPLYRGVVLWSFGRCSTITEHITLVLRSLVTPESACNCIRCELRQPDACPCSCMDDRACNGQQIVC